MSQPTLAAIPGILLRTITHLLARILMTIAAIFLGIGLAFGFATTLLMTWRSPRGRRTQLTVDLIVAAVVLAKEIHREHKTVTKTD